jgi:hypothetical protein
VSACWCGECVLVWCGTLFTCLTCNRYRFETIESAEDPLAKEIATVVWEWGRLLLVQYEDPNRDDERYDKLRSTLINLIA